MFDKNYQPNDRLLSERVVLITGAGDGIGRSVALACARVGAVVVLLGRTVRKLESVYDQIIENGGREPAIYPMDLLGAGADDYDTLVEQLSSQLGRLDGLVHNAALLGRLGPIEHYDLETWGRVIQVNVTASFLMSRACLPLLRAAPAGSVIFTTSGVGRRGRAYWGAYAVSKFANEGLMQVLADETENSHVRVNCINPGAVRTQMRAAAYPAENPDRLVSPDAVVGPYLYLLGDDAADVTGRTVDAQ